MSAITYTVGPIYNNGPSLKTVGITGPNSSVRLLHVSLVDNPSSVGGVQGIVANVFLAPLTFSLFGATLQAGTCHVTFETLDPMPSFSF